MTRPNPGKFYQIYDPGPLEEVLESKPIVLEARKTNEKVVAIASGGLDSSTMLYSLKHWGYIVKVLTFDYGQRHSREIEAAKHISELLGMKHEVVDISDIHKLIDTSALTHGQEVPDVPETAEHYETLKQTIVPNRNAIMLSIAVGHAVSIGARKVYYAPHASDRGVYPDCRREFVDAFQHAERLATDVYNLCVVAPFIEIDKADIVVIGTDLDVPFKETWTCYKGGAKHCGVCSACRERKLAFVTAEAFDPTEYAA